MRILLPFLLFSAACVAVSCGNGGDKPTVSTADHALAKTILVDTTLDTVLEKAKNILSTGFNAGDGYGEVWIRDFATFVELSCDVTERGAIRDALLMFFKFQGDDGNIIDGYIPRERGNAGYDYIESELESGWLGHKNTVETDQESSLVQAVHTFIETTGDRAFLDEHIGGVTVLDRMEAALEFLLNERYVEKYGLIWGATTADWGDVQPEHDWGVYLTDETHRSIDIYDNAMFVLAMKDFIAMLPGSDSRGTRWEGVLERTEANIRTHLWDGVNSKYIPHIYLEGSPFPEDFDESEVYYHGGTAVAILAGLLTPDEIARSLEHMRDNVKKSGAATIGLTLYPPYPEGSFKNPGMGPYSYQNGGDWTWFGGRMIQALIANGFAGDAYTELRPMLDRVIANDGFYEWYTVDNKPKGSGTFRGSAGVLGSAIKMLKDWAVSVDTIKAETIS